MKQRVLISLFIALLLGCSSSSRPANNATSTTASSPTATRPTNEVAMATALCSLPTKRELVGLLSDTAPEDSPQVPGNHETSAPNCTLSGARAWVEIQVANTTKPAALGPPLAEARRNKRCQASEVAPDETAYECTSIAALAADKGLSPELYVAVFGKRYLVIAGWSGPGDKALPADAKGKLALLRQIALRAVKQDASP